MFVYGYFTSLLRLGQDANSSYPWLSITYSLVFIIPGLITDNVYPTLYLCRAMLDRSHVGELDLVVGFASEYHKEGLEEVEYP